MYSWMLVVLICLLIVGLMTITSTEEGFVTVDADSALAQRQLLQFEGERRYNTLARVQNPASNPSSDTVDQSITMLIPTETDSTSSRLRMTPSSRGLGAADDGTNKRGQGVEQTGMVQEKINFCESLPINCDFSDPRMAECGMCHKGGVNSKGEPWRGGMYISSDDQILANQANKDANPNNNLFGPSAVYKPTVGTCPPKNFTLVKETCQARENALQCEMAPGPTTGNSCAQCYGNAGPLLYVGAKPRSFQAILHMSHPGAYSGGTIKTGNSTVRLIPSTKNLLDPQQFPLTMSEGDTITIQIAGAPTIWCAWLSSPDGKRSVSLDVGVQSITPAAFGVIGDKLSLRITRAFSGETGFPAFKALVPNSVLWYGRNNKIPGIIVSAKYGTSIGNSVSVLEGARRLAASNQSITISPQQLGVSDPSPDSTKQLWIKMDTGTNYIGSDGDVLESRLFKSILSITVTCPVTLVDPVYDFDVEVCPSGPMIFTEAGAGIMGSNSCYKSDGTFNPSLYCIQQLFTGAGGNQNGTLWPDSKEKLAAIVKSVNGVPDIDATSSFLSNLGNIATYAQDQNGSAVTFEIYLDASMKMLGTAPKNLCEGPNADTGPHTPQCLDFLWKTSGSASSDPVTSYNFCGRAGLMAPLNLDGTPNENNIAMVNDEGSVAAVKAYYKSIFDAAKDTSNFNKWTKSMANCYNSNVGAPPPPSSANCPKKGIPNVSFIQLGHGPSVINLSQLAAFDSDGNNVTRGKPATGTTTYQGGPYVGRAEFAVDGTEQARDWPSIYHSVAQSGDVFEVSLGRPTTIAQVTVFSRVGFTERTLGHSVRLLDANRTILYNSAPLIQALVQSVNLKVSVPVPVVAKASGYTCTPGVDNDQNAGNIGCAGWTPDQLRAECDKNPNCKAYNTWGDAGCLKNRSNITNFNNPTIRAFCVKNTGSTQYPIDLGCWKDAPDRVLKGPYGGWGNTPEMCKNLAERTGQKYYSVQAGSECYTGNSGYDRVGRASGDCPPGGHGWIAHTWQRTP